MKILKEIIIEFRIGLFTWILNKSTHLLPKEARKTKHWLSQIPEENKDPN